MKVLWILARLRMLEVLRVPSTRFFFFGLPLVLLLLVGVIFAHGHPFERRRLAVVGDSGSLLKGCPELRLEQEDSLDSALGKLRAHLVSGVLLAPKRLLVGAPDRLWGKGLQQELPGVNLELVESPPWGFVHYVFPGLLCFSVVMSGLFGLGHNLARYRQSRLLRKLSTTPLSPVTFVAAQILGRGALVLAQSALMVALAWLLFGLPLTPGRALGTLALTALGTLTFLGVGFILACLIRSEGLLYDAISAVGWPLVLLSEMFFPVDELPGPLPTLAGALPSTQLVRLLRSVLLYSDPHPASLAQGVAILALWAALCFGVGCLLFRWND